jgi:hypothetical protein
MTDTLTQKDIDAIKEDLAALKRDLTAAVADIREARGAASGIAQQLSDEASALYREVADRGTKATEALGAKVEEQPITSVLLAFCVGYIVSRITR